MSRRAHIAAKGFDPADKPWWLRRTARASSAIAPIFTAALLANAFLLFLVQPMFAKTVLPLLGGAPAVWAACMLFFQAALLTGYGYVHATNRLTVSRQAALHTAVLAVPLDRAPVSSSRVRAHSLRSTNLSPGWSA